MLIDYIGAGGDIIITSRNGDIDRLGKLLKVPPLTNDESIRLLLRDYDESQVARLRVDAEKIVLRLGNLALAVDQAAAYLNYQRASPEAVSNFLAAYEAKKGDILRYTPKKFWEYGTVQIHGVVEQNKALNAFTTWEMSLQHLQSNGDIAADDLRHFLTLASFLGSTDVAEFLFKWHQEQHDDDESWMYIFAEAGGSEPHSETTISEGIATDESSSSEAVRSKDWDHEKFWSVLSQCKDLTLIQNVRRQNETQDQEASFDFHPLIRDWLQQRLGSIKRLSYQKEAVSMIASCARMTDRGKTSSTQRLLLPSHAEPCVATISRMIESMRMSTIDDAALDQLSWIANVYRKEVQFAVAKSLYRQELDARTAYIGSEHPSTLTSISNLAVVLDSQGDYAAAEKMHRETLLLRERVLGKEHPHTLASMNNLARVLDKQEKHGEAEAT